MPQLTMAIIYQNQTLWATGSLMRATVTPLQMLVVKAKMELYMEHYGKLEATHNLKLHH